MTARQTSSGSRRGVTIRELAALLVVVGFVTSCCIALKNPPRRGCYIPKDPTQLRGIHQGMVLWSQLPTAAPTTVIDSERARADAMSLAMCHRAFVVSAIAHGAPP